MIPRGTGMSGRHAEIVRRYDGRTWSWHLHDLESTNGTFARASSVILHQDQEFAVSGCVSFRSDHSVKGAGDEETVRASATLQVVGTGSSPAEGARRRDDFEALPHRDLQRDRGSPAHVDGCRILDRADASRCTIVVKERSSTLAHAPVPGRQGPLDRSPTPRSRCSVWGRISGG